MWILGAKDDSSAEVSRRQKTEALAGCDIQAYSFAEMMVS